MGGRGQLSPAMKLSKSKMEGTLNWVKSKGVKHVGQHTKVYQSLANNKFLMSKIKNSDSGGNFRNAEYSAKIGKTNITFKSGRYGNYITFD